MPAVLAILGIVGIIQGLMGQIVQILARPIINHLNALDPDVPLSPADAADGVERNIIDATTGAGYAASSGVAPDVFNLMTLLTGEPPGLEQMLSLNRRGLLDDETLTKMIAYSRVRTEWTEYVKLLAFQTMSPGDAIECALKGVLDDSAAKTLFTQAGGLDTQWDTLLAVAGNPVGVEQANRLFNHSLITHEQLVQVILHSRINPTFEPMAELLHFQYLSAFQIEAMLKAGSATPQQATEWLLAEGYPTDQVTAMVTGASSTKAVANKELTEAQISRAYDAGILTQAQATVELENLGYTDTDIPYVLALYDYERKLSMAQAAVGQVRKVFLAGRITSAQASNYLDSLEIDPVARDYFLKLWAVEAQTELKSLSAVNIGQSTQSGAMTYPEATQMLVKMGYTESDAEIFLVYYGGPVPGAAPAPAAPAA